MIDISGKTYSQILADMLSYISGELNKREGSLIRTSLAAAAWAIEGLYLDLAYIQKQAYGTTATGEYLDKKVAEVGLTRKPATYAIKNARFNAAPSIGDLFAVKGIPNSVYYRVSSAAVNEPDSDYPDTPFIAQMTCETAGTIGNDYTGELSSVEFIQGITRAILLDVVDDGEDEESDDSLRSRYLAYVGVVQFAGNIAAYRNFLLSQPGVGAVQVYPTWQGAGTVLCSCVDDDFFPLTPAEVATLQNLVCPPEDGGSVPSANGYGIAPIGAAVTIVTAQSVSINVTSRITISPNSGKTISDIQDAAQVSIQNYINECCKSWGTMGSWDLATYSLRVYINKIAGILNTLDGVLVADSTQINGQNEDVVLTENSTTQQVPILSSVILTEA